MPVTLAQVKAAAQSKTQQGVIDDFRRRSILLDVLPFDDMSYPNASGHGWVYTYSRLETPSPAQVRAINTEYTPGEAVSRPVTVELKVMGGSYQVDRAIVDTGYVYNHLAFQTAEKVKSAVSLAQDLMINGDPALRENEPEGLSVMLRGTDTEFNAGAVVDLSTADLLTSNHAAFLDQLDEWLSSMNVTPNAIFGNQKILGRIRSAARRAGYLDRSLDGFGRQVDRYNGVLLIDLGTKADNSGPVIPVETRTIGEAQQTGVTDLYAVSIGLDGFHGVAPQGGTNLVRTYLPDLSAPGAVKTGEVEMTMAYALKTTRAAAVFRNIKVQ